ncbi:MAG: gephyrin-like molybdotransferase Glp [Chloroflexota bacterium]|nr:gephyrin-like molybdotransferase Glp [Chloroflexota bacterium]
MISVEEALERVLSYVKVLDAVETPVLECLGQALDEDAYSSIDIPPRDNSAMDGYALRVDDIIAASASSPVCLDVIGESKAGALCDIEVKPNTAIRIMTGAFVPKGADTVVMFEDTDETERKGQPLKRIGIMQATEKGKNVRYAGEDVAAGQLVLKRGTVLRPAEIGVLASLGIDRAKVIRRPIVAILATGDELTELGRPLPDGKIYNSNSYSAAAQVLRYGGIPKILGIAKDTAEDLEAKIKEALTADMLLTTGGVSMGDYDLVKDILSEMGEISFWRVRMKPGKPLAFGTIQGVPHLGLPGNPVSSMITFELFARSAILKMMGKPVTSKPTVEATSESHIKNTDGRRVYARAIVRKEGDRYYASTTGPQGSGILTSMSMANALTIVPEDVDAVREGDTVRAIMLDWEE